MQNSNPGFSVNPPIDHNSGISWEEDQEARKQSITSAIASYVVGEARIAEALRREELAQFEGLQRALAIRNGVMAGLARYCRANPMADATQAVYVLISFLADNNEGRCRLSMRRMGEVLGRSERRIREAISRLVDCKLIDGQTPKGLPHSYWPVMPRALSDTGASMAWFVDALSRGTSRTPKIVPIRSEAGPRTQVSGVSQHPGTHMSGPAAATPDTSVPSEREHPDTHVRTGMSQPRTPATPTPDAGVQQKLLTNTAVVDINNIYTRAISNAGPEVVTKKFHPTAKHFSDYHQLYNSWKRKPGFVFNELDRLHTDKNLLSAIEIFAAEDQDVLSRAVDEAFHASLSAHNDCVQMGTLINQTGRFPNFFVATLRAAIGKISAEIVKTQTAKVVAVEIAGIHIDKERRIADRGVGAFDRAVERGERSATQRPRWGGGKRPVANAGTMDEVARAVMAEKRGIRHDSQ